MIAYSCFVIFLAYKNCKFKAGGGHDCVDALCLLLCGYHANPHQDNTCFDAYDTGCRMTKLFEEYIYYRGV